MDIRTAFEFHSLHNTLKTGTELNSCNENTVLEFGAFQKLLADKTFVTIPSETSLNNKIVAPQSYGSCSSALTINAMAPNPAQSLSEQLQVYKNEQLRAHPGGDYINLKADDSCPEQAQQLGVLENIAKDIKDALGNVGNFFRDLLSGSEYRYVDDQGQVQTGKRKGFLGNLVSFFQDVASGLSFGLYRQNGDFEPHGIVEHAQFVYKKLVDEAFVDDVILGVPSSAINLLDDGALALWNFLEVVPDATLGTIPAARRLSTTVFDNGQVIIDYITDCLPTSEAWMRVHAYQFENGRLASPVLFNFTLPERYSGDSRWSAVRNTPLRKTIETIGSLMADMGLAAATYHAIRTSKNRD